MKVCILGPRNKGFEELCLIKESKKLFDKVVYVRIPSVKIESKDKVKIVAKNIDLMKFDCIIPRIPRTYMNYGYAICKLLEGKVFMPNRPESIILAHHKFLTLLYLDSSGIPIPKTYLASTRAVVEKVLDRIDYPVVMKLIYGSRGKGVMFAESKSSAIALVDTIESIKQPIFVEEYLHPGDEDIRAIVVGNKVIAAMKRKSKEGDKRANIGAGGSGEKIELDKSIESLALKTAKSLCLGIVGVDIIMTPTGPKVIEANVNVNFEGITKVTKINIAKKMVKYIYQQVR